MARRGVDGKLPEQDIEFVARRICEMRQIDPDQMIIIGQLQRHLDPDFMYWPQEYQAHPAWHAFCRVAYEALTAVGELAEHKEKSNG